MIKLSVALNLQFTDDNIPAGTHCTFPHVASKPLSTGNVVTVQIHVFARFVYTYRGLTESELEEYLSFSETEAGRKYNSVLKKKSNAALLDSNKKILTSIIRVINEDSWVNIQKDLNQPIQETQKLNSEFHRNKSMRLSL